MKIYLNRNFLLAYAASFISLFGSKLLMMSYVAYIYAEQGKAMLASIVFAAEWATCLLVGLFGTQYIDRMNAKRLLVGLNVVAALVTLLFVQFISPQYYSYAVGIIILRALLTHAINSSRIKALVQFFTKEQTDTFSPVFNSSMFIAMALAGAVGIYILRFIDFTTVVYIDSATFLIAAALFALTRPNQERLAESILAARGAVLGRWAYIKDAFGIIIANRHLASAVFYIILAVTCFQATYEILMIIIPQVWFNLGKSGTALFFTFESLFVTLGSFLYQFLSSRQLITAANQRRLNLFAVLFAAAVYLSITQLRHQLYLCLAVFNVMVVLVELIWTHQFKQLIANSPAARIAAVSGVQMALGYSLMGVFAYGFSTGVDRWGISTAMFINVLLVALLVAGWEFMMKSPADEPTGVVETNLALPALDTERPASSN